MCASCPQRPEERVRPPGTGVQMTMTCHVGAGQPGSSRRVSNAFNCWALKPIKSKTMLNSMKINKRKWPEFCSSQEHRMQLCSVRRTAAERKTSCAVNACPLTHSTEICYLSKMQKTLVLEHS